MTQLLTDDPTKLVDQIIAVLTAAEVSLGLQDIFWGDQDMIPRTPAIAVEPSTLTQSLYATGHQTENQFLTNIMIYHSKVQDNQTTQKECADYSIAVRNKINEDLFLDGLVTLGFVRQTEVGYASRNKVFMRAARLSHVSKSYTRLQ